MGMLGALISTFPMEQHLKLEPSDGDLLEGPLEYHRFISCPIYLTITRSDILYHVRVLSQFMGTLRCPLLDAALRVLRYLKGFPGNGIMLSSINSIHVSAYCDADWDSCPTTCHSTTGCCTFLCTFLGLRPISWRTKKQQTVCHTSAEAEHKAMAQISCELQWLSYFIYDLCISHP